MSHLPHQDQLRSASQAPMYDQLPDLRAQVSNPFGHQGSSQSQHGDNSYNGSQMRTGQPFNPHENRGYSSNDYPTQGGSIKVESGVGKYLTGSKQLHRSVYLLLNINYSPLKLQLR